LYRYTGSRTETGETAAFQEALASGDMNSMIAMMSDPRAAETKPKIRFMKPEFRLAIGSNMNRRKTPVRPCHAFDQFQQHRNKNLILPE
jgi:hypothetical protein